MKFSSRIFTKANTVILALIVAIGLYWITNLTQHFFESSNAVGHWLLWVKNDGGADSWKPMLKALYWQDRLENGTLYQYLFFERDVKFQYPPSSLLPLSLLKVLGIRPTFFVLNDISWLAVLVTAGAAGWLGVILSQRVEEVGISTAPKRWMVAGLAGLATLTFYPIVKAYSLGQVQAWINALFALSCLGWMTNRRRMAGIGIGLICLIKPQFSLFLLWGIIRKQWPFVLSWLAVVVSGLLLSIALYGWGNMIGYLHVMQFLSQRGESFYPNQSVNGLLNRAFFIGNNLVWEADSFPPYDAIVHYGTVISSAVLVLLALFWGIKGPESANFLDFLCAALTFTLASPIAWEHHYGILPPILITLLFCIQTVPQTCKRAVLWSLLGLVYFLSANFLEFLNCFAATPWNFIQSYLFFAALLVLGLLYRLRGSLSLKVA